MRPQIRFKISNTKKKNTISQLNTVNNTDTVIDLKLNTNLFILIDQPFSMDKIHNKYSAIKKTIQRRKGNLKNEAETRCQSNNQNCFDHRFNDSIQMSQWRVQIKLILLLTKIIKDVSSYSKGVQKESVKDGTENEELTIFSV